MTHKLGLVLFLTLLLLACNKPKVQLRTGQASGAVLEFATDFKKAVPTESESLLEVRNFQAYPEGFSVADPYVNKSCYLFDPKGELILKVGNTGQGPGEYIMPAGFVKNGERFFVSSSADKKIIVYDRLGQYITDDFHKIEGVITTMIPWEKGFLALVVSRYANKMLFLFDESGKLVDSKMDRKEPSIPFDTFAPAGGLFSSEGRTGLFLNFRYEIMWLNQDLQVTGMTKMASSLFVPPDLKLAAAADKQAPKRKEYRASFSQLAGVYPSSMGFVTRIVTWENPSESRQFLEFWDANFQGYGRYEIPEEEIFLGVIDNRMVFVDTSEGFSSFVFKTIHSIGATNEKFN